MLAAHTHTQFAVLSCLGFAHSTINYHYKFLSVIWQVFFAAVGAAAFLLVENEFSSSEWLLLLFA